MKKLFTLFSAFTFSIGLFAQITITSADMPGVGDTTRLSNASVLFGIDPSVSGSDFEWDFSTLTPLSQVVEGYVSPQSTPFIYQLVFNQSVANLASPIQVIDFLPGFEITNAYIFYRNTNSSYVRAGYAATIANIPVPMKFDQPELIYSFPLEANSTPDSSLSNFSFEFPGVGFLSIERKRVNQVDGWGTVTTPYGTFNSLRIKSEIHERDSIYIDSVQVGVPVNRFYTEYKWLANGFNLPVLTITQEGPMLTAQYIDTVRNLTPLTVELGPEQSVCSGDSVTITAHASGGTPPYTFLWNTLETTESIRVAPDTTTTYSVIVTDMQNNMAFGSSTINVTEFIKADLGADTLQICADASVLLDTGEGFENVVWYVNDNEQAQGQFFEVDSTGIGLNFATIRVEYTSNGCQAKDTVVVNFYICGGIQEQNSVKIKLSPNPARNYITVETDKFSVHAQLIILSSDGRTVLPVITRKENQRFVLDTGLLSKGSYLLMITEDNLRAVARFIIK